MKHQRNYLSYIRAFASLGIVFLHTFTMCSMAFPDYMTGMDGLITNLVPYLMMWAVPCFVMVTGALLLDDKRELTLKKLFGKYILRIVAVLIIFIILFRLLDIWMNKESFSLKVFSEALIKLYTDTSWAHLWYLYLLIGLYLLMPFFRKIASASDNRELIFLIIVYIFFISVIPILNDLTGASAGFYITTNSIFPAYLFIGYMIDSGRFRIRPLAGMVMTVAGIATIVIMTWREFGPAGLKDGSMSRWLGGYSFLPVIILSVGIFSLFMRMGGAVKEDSILGKVLLPIDKCSFGIYLIHLAFLRYVFKCTTINPYISGGCAYVVLIAVLVFIASYVVIRILKLIPYVNKII